MSTTPTLYETIKVSSNPLDYVKVGDWYWVKCDPDHGNKKEHEHLFCVEAEVLSTGLVHISVSDAEGDVDAIVVSNGPEIQEGMEQMLRNQRWLKEKRTNVK